MRLKHLRLKALPFMIIWKATSLSSHPIKSPHQHAYYSLLKPRLSSNRISNCILQFCEDDPSLSKCGRYFISNAEDPNPFDGRVLQAVLAERDLCARLHSDRSFFRAWRQCGEQPISVLSTGLPYFSYEDKGRQISYDIFSDL